MRPSRSRSDAVWRGVGRLSDVLSLWATALTTVAPLLAGGIGLYAPAWWAKPAALVIIAFTVALTSLRR